jgi:putative ATPase
MAADLFDQAHQDRLKSDAPLAARMRPRILDEYVGQAHIVGPGRLLRRAIEADQLGSLIFYGPPGTGKTTLAQVIANTTRAHFIACSRASRKSAKQSPKPKSAAASMASARFYL